MEERLELEGREEEEAALEEREGWGCLDWGARGVLVVEEEEVEDVCRGVEEVVGFLGAMAEVEVRRSRACEYFDLI